MFCEISYFLIKKVIFVSSTVIFYFKLSIIELNVPKLEKSFSFHFNVPAVSTLKEPFGLNFVKFDQNLINFYFRPRFLIIFMVFTLSCFAV